MIKNQLKTTILALGIAVFGSLFMPTVVFADPPQSNANTDTDTSGQTADEASKGSTTPNGGANANFDIQLEKPPLQVGDDFASKGINRVFFWAGVLAVIMVIVGGVQYALSAGNADKIKQAKYTIIFALVGLGLVLISFAIVKFILEVLGA